jgi:hypothetical protein
MTRHMHYSIALASLALLTVFGDAIAAVPTHCRSNEYSLVDAWIGKVHQTQYGHSHNKDSKILSLCADTKAQPFSKVSYRYGHIGQVELEVVATPHAKFGNAYCSTGPHTGLALTFFKKGEYTYYISEATGQGHGVSLNVFKGNKHVFGGFSGNVEGEDYQNLGAGIDLPNAINSVFADQPPEHADSLGCN